MKHPVRDRFWIFLCGLCVLCAAAAVAALALGKLPVAKVTELLACFSDGVDVKARAALIGAAAVLVLVAVRLFAILTPAKKKRSSNFAYQQNENGMVRISVKALDALVQRCLSQHPELKVVSSSLFSDEESVSVDAHITLQSDISMPLAISALQKQIKRYLEACSGVVVEEVRVFVDGTTPSNAETAHSPYAIPTSVLEEDADLSELKEEATEELLIDQCLEQETEAAAEAPQEEAAAPASAEEEQETEKTDEVSE
ncbi:MAG: alkaline shock response membrane anchor protein AmaP [Clostridia bacterium]|nr:alkaline shock response membrane anchor protein AmaP [Clostridia bacterium]